MDETCGEEDDGEGEGRSSGGYGHRRGAGRWLCRSFSATLALQSGLLPPRPFCAVSSSRYQRVGIFSSKSTSFLKDSTHSRYPFKPVLARFQDISTSEFNNQSDRYLAWRRGRLGTNLWRSFFSPCISPTIYPTSSHKSVILVVLGATRM